MPNPFARAIRIFTGNGPSEAEQKALTKPHKDGVLTDEHAAFIQTVLLLIDGGKIDTKNPQSFVRKSVYGPLPLELKRKIDLAIPNIITLLERIMDLHLRPENNDSYEMKNLIESLWLIKERIEREADVFIF